MPLRPTTPSLLAGLRRCVAVLAGTALIIGIGASTTEAVVRPDAVDEAAALAERFAPYVAIQQQDAQCGPGEAFQPADVSMILDQPDVVLRDASGAVVTTAPSAADLFNAPEGSNFDLPGSTLQPGCDYDRRFGRRTTADRPVMYSRVVTEAPEANANGSASRLVVQYWLYFVYNDWNNLHESDWEMAQIVFDAATPAEALTKGPSLMSLSQHYGNERRPWDRIERVGDRPVIYPARGSHAIFSTQNLWFGMSGDAGFGCDDTRAPSTRLDPSVIMLPDTVTADSGFGWLGFKGRWGERQRVALNDSERGPQYTPQWLDPFGYTDSGRDSAVSVPQLDLGVTRFFCAATTNVSRAMNRLLATPGLLLLVVVCLVMFILLLARRTRWKPVTATPLMMRRRAGQILSSAWALVLVHRRRYLAVWLLVFVGGIVGVIIQPWVLRHTFLGALATDINPGAVSGTVSALAAGAMETIPVLIAAVIIGVFITHGIEAPPPERQVRRALRSNVALPVLVGFVALVVTGPFALVLAPALIAAPAAASAEQLRTMPALRRSWHLTRTRRIRSFVFAFAVLIGSLMLAPLFGVLVMLVIGGSFTFVNLIAGVVNAFTMPWLGAAIYLHYTDLAMATAVEDDGPSEVDG